MKKIKIVALFFTGTFLLSLIYSCVKESMANDNGKVKGVEKSTNVAQALADSCSSLCSKYKTITVTPANFFGPYTGPGIELNSKLGRASIVDAEVQPSVKLNVTVFDALNYEATLPLFTIAADGSYELLSYKYISSILLLYYVRYNKTANTFTYKPVNNLTVKYSVTKLN